MSARPKSGPDTQTPSAICASMSPNVRRRHVSACPTWTEPRPRAYRSRRLAWWTGSGIRAREASISSGLLVAPGSHSRMRSHRFDHERDDASLQGPCLKSLFLLRSGPELESLRAASEQTLADRRPVDLYQQSAASSTSRTHWYAIERAANFFEPLKQIEVRDRDGSRHLANSLAPRVPAQWGSRYKKSGSNARHRP